MRKKRVKSHVLEKVISGFMILFGFLAGLIFYNALSTKSSAHPISAIDLAIIEILIIIIIAILSQTILLIRIYEQHE